MKAVWVGGPKDGEVLELPDGTEKVKITLPPIPSIMDDPEGLIVPESVVFPVLPFRTRKGLRTYGIDYYRLSERGFLNG